MTSYITAFSVLTIVVLATVLVPFISIHFFVDEIDVLPNRGVIITTTAFRTRLWASLLGRTFIGFPAGKAVSAGDANVADVGYADVLQIYAEPGAHRLQLGRCRPHGCGGEALP